MPELINNPLKLLLCFLLAIALIPTAAFAEAVENPAPPAASVEATKVRAIIVENELTVREDTESELDMRQAMDDLRL